MIGFDVLTGWMKAIYKGDFKSSAMRHGLLAKVAEMLILFLMYIFEYMLPLIHIDLGLPLVAIVGTYIVIMELSSVIENIGSINPSLALKLSSIFADFIGKDKESDEE